MLLFYVEQDQLYIYIYIVIVLQETTPNEKLNDPFLFASLILHFYTVSWVSREPNSDIKREKKKKKSQKAEERKRRVNLGNQTVWIE